MAYFVNKTDLCLLAYLLFFKDEFILNCEVFNFENYYKNKYIQHFQPEFPFIRIEQVSSVSLRITLLDRTQAQEWLNVYLANWHENRLEAYKNDLSFPYDNSAKKINDFKASINKDLVLSQYKITEVKHIEPILYFESMGKLKIKDMSIASFEEEKCIYNYFNGVIDQTDIEDYILDDPYLNVIMYTNVEGIFEDNIESNEKKREKHSEEPEKGARKKTLTKLTDTDIMFLSAAKYNMEKGTEATTYEKIGKIILEKRTWNIKVDSIKKSVQKIKNIYGIEERGLPAIVNVLERRNYNIPELENLK